MGKVCIYCHEDCSNRPRLKDGQGRYACKACAERHGATGGTAGAGAAAAAAASPAEAAPANGADAVLLDLIEQAGPIAVADPAGGIAEQRLCPACARAMPADAVLCTQCGFDTRKGFQKGTGVGADSRKPGITKCPHCGYDMRVLRDAKCPECGKLALPKSQKERSREASRETAISAYRTPAIMFAVGITISLIFIAMWAQKRGVDVATSMKYYVVDYVLAVPAALLAFCIVGWLWMGFNAPLHLLAIQFAAVFAVTDAVQSVMLAALPLTFLFFMWIISVITYVGLLMQLMEMDVEDAIMLTVVMYGTNVAIRLYVAPQIYELLGL
ncbi:MAG: hypothetical protein JNJ48_03100 [Phycisphaerae bacterium]|nr:hypothetical protein [Phycisphaerae bacterium]